MHDPDHVVLDIRRPPLTPRELRGHKRRRGPRDCIEIGPIIVRPRKSKCYSCTDGKAHTTYEALGIYEGDPCPDCAGRGYNIIAHRRRPFFSWFEWRGVTRSWYLPSVITIWHRDPETDGTDSSCRNHYRRRWREASKDPGRWVQREFWAWCMRRYDRWHIHHWRIQVRPIQNLRRWAFTRCAGCGERLPYGYSPISSHWDSPRRERWWSSEVGLWHHECYDAHRKAVV